MTNREKLMQQMTKMTANQLALYFLPVIDRKKHAKACFFQRCVPLARNVMRPLDVMSGFAD